MRSFFRHIVIPWRFLLLMKPTKHLQISRERCRRTQIFVDADTKILVLNSPLEQRKISCGKVNTSISLSTLSLLTSSSYLCRKKWVHTIPICKHPLQHRFVNASREIRNANLGFLEKLENLNLTSLRGSLRSIRWNFDSFFQQPFDNFNVPILGSFIKPRGADRRPDRAEPVERVEVTSPRCNRGNGITKLAAISLFENCLQKRKIIS